MEEATLLEEMQKTNRLLRSQLLWSRLAAALLAALLALVLVLFFSLSRALSRFPQSVGEVDLSAISAQLEKLDMDALNDTLLALKGKIDEVDIRALNEAVINLNNAVAALQDASDSIRAWEEAFSDSFAGLFGTLRKAAP